MKTTALVVGALLGTSAATQSNAASPYGDNWYVYTRAAADALSTAVGSVEQSGMQCSSNTALCPVTDRAANSHSAVSARSDANAAGYLDYTGPFSVFNGPTLGSGFAAADLATGKLHISTLAIRSADANADARFSDLIHFNNITSSRTITIKLHIDGSYATSTQPLFSFFLSDGYTDTLQTFGRWADGNNTVINLSSPTTTYQPFETLGSWQAYGPQNFVASFTIDPRFPDALIIFGLQAGGAGASFANFADTAAVSFDLPANVSFTSASGAFLTAPSGAPEPATWALLVAGFGAVGVAARRRSVVAA